MVIALESRRFNLQMFNFIDFFIDHHLLSLDRSHPFRTETISHTVRFASIYVLHDSIETKKTGAYLVIHIYLTLFYPRISTLRLKIHILKIDTYNWAETLPCNVCSGLLYSFYHHQPNWTVLFLTFFAKTSSQFC